MEVRDLRKTSRCPQCKTSNTLRHHGYDMNGFIYECTKCGWKGYIEDTLIDRKYNRKRD